jgi:hypothetical protein
LVARGEPDRLKEGETRLIIVTALALAPLLAVDNESAKRLDEAAAVFSEVM